MKMRECPKCLLVKPVRTFYPDDRMKGRPRRACDVCYATKECSKCGVEKPLSEYGSKGNLGRPRSACRKCESLSTQEWAQKYPERAAALAERNRLKTQTPEYRAKAAAAQSKFRAEQPERWKDMQERAFLKRVYGVSRDDLQAMLAKQGSKCLLCETPLTWKTRHVDHVDTPTGPIVRGILCRLCNIALGHFHDDADLMRRAANYVERFQASEVNTGDLQRLA